MQSILRLHISLLELINPIILDPRSVYFKIESSFVRGFFRNLGVDNPLNFDMIIRVGILEILNLEENDVINFNVGVKDLVTPSKEKNFLYSILFCP